MSWVVLFLWIKDCAAAAAKSLQSCLILSDRPHRWQPTRLRHPWDSPGKNTGVGCHFLLQCMKVKSENEVVQLCPTLHDPMDCSLPGSSIHGIFQARVLEWGAIAFSRIKDVKSFFMLCLSASSVLSIISSLDCHSVACWLLLLLPRYYFLNGCSLSISFVTLLCLIPCLLISLSLCFLLPHVIRVSLY